MERLYNKCRIISIGYRTGGTDSSENWKVRFQIIAADAAHQVIGKMTDACEIFPSKMAAEAFGISRAKEIIDKKSMSS